MIPHVFLESVPLMNAYVRVHGCKEPACICIVCKLYVRAACVGGSLHTVNHEHIPRNLYSWLLLGHAMSLCFLLFAGDTSESSRSNRNQTRISPSFEHIVSLS